MPKSAWTALGEGTFNVAYRSRDGREVLKIQKDALETDTPERSVRLWNAMNSHVPPPARIDEWKGKRGWVCPFVQGRQASDKEMSGALVDIFNNTGRIVVDATAPKNFITTPKGQVICIDVGMAIQLERREDARFSGSRRKSVVSLDLWSNQDLVNQYDEFFQSYAEIYPETVNTVKALLFIKINRPDIYNTDFLKNNPALVNKLARAYDSQNIAGATKHLDMAVQPTTVTLPEDRAKHEIENFKSFLADKGIDVTSADLTLSDPYATILNNTFTTCADIEIRNPRILDLFREYTVQEALVAKQKLNIYADHNAKLEKISDITENIKNDPYLSESNRKFGIEHCDKLAKRIQAGSLEIKSERRPEEKCKQIDKDITAILNNMKKAAKTDGDREIVNNAFTAFDLSEPFNLVNYGDKLEKIEAIKSQASNNPAFSQAEKNFLVTYCDKLTATIEQVDADLWSKEESKQLETQLDDMVRDSQKIAQTEGFRGVINDIFAVFGLEKPFTITNSPAIDTARKMKQELTAIKNEGMEPGESSEIDPSDTGTAFH